MNSKLASSVKIDTDATVKSSDLKLWHYALLIGVPSAAVLAYYLYRRSQSQAATTKKNSDPKKTKSEFVNEKPSGKESSTPKKNQKPKVGYELGGLYL